MQVDRPHTKKSISQMAFLYCYNNYNFSSFTYNIQRSLYHKWAIEKYFSIIYQTLSSSHQQRVAKPLQTCSSIFQLILKLTLTKLVHRIRNVQKRISLQNSFLKNFIKVLEEILFKIILICLLHIFILCERLEEERSDIG